MTAKIIDLSKCCSKGLTLAIQERDALKQHRMTEYFKIMEQERQHLVECVICGAQDTGTMYQTLWPGAKVTEA